MNEELKMRQQHIKDALMRALNAAATGNWFDVLAATQEAEIITRSVQDETRRSTQ